MVRLRRVPVLVSTVALVAGCGSADRVEITGVVRDGRTGTPLAGARVTGAGGVATRTDAQGRFRLTIARGLRTQLRVSAEGHADAVQSLGSPEALGEVGIETLSFELEPMDPEDSPLDAHAVIRWDTAPWVSDSFSRGHAEARLEIDSGRADATVVMQMQRPCPAVEGSPRGETPEVLDADSEDEASDPEINVGGRPAPWLGRGGACVSCHRDDIAGPQANVLIAGPHAGLADSCLACHERNGRARLESCARCHAENRIEYDTTYREWHVELDIGLRLRSEYSEAVQRARDAMARRTSRAVTLERWLDVLERDGSRGAHDPYLLREMASALSPQ